MKRSAPLKPGRGFAPKFPPRLAKQYPSTWSTRPREAAVRVATTVARLTLPIPKSNPARHEGYRRLVAAMPCIHCQRVDRSQAAHPNAGKGLALKADDRECFPLCADSPGEAGCHSLFDQGALFTKSERRRRETQWGFATRAAMRADRAWPADLQPWPEDEVAS